MTEEGVIRARGKAIVKALRVIADVTNSPFTMETKDGRIRIQKIVYLLKAAGYDPAQKFDFNIYQYGPYSPGLTEVYYTYGSDSISEAQPATDLGRPLLDAIRLADSKGILFLEALATALDTTASLIKAGKPGAGAGPGLRWARTIKPHIDESTWREVRLFLRDHPDFAGST